MPLKPLDKPTDKKEENKPEKQKKPVSPNRIAIIGVVVILGLVFSKLLVLKPVKIANSHQSKEVPDTNHLIPDIRKQTGGFLASAQRDTSKIIGQVLGENTKNLSKIANKPVESVSDYVVEQAVTSILSQIKKLPKRQQEIIHQQLCK